MGEERETCTDINKINVLWVWMGDRWVVLGCPCRLVPNWVSIYIVLIGTFDSSKGIIVAAVGPVWKPHVQFQVFRASVEDT